MAGHSKWANIKHRKGRQDALRGKQNTKLIREITVASRESGADPKSNPRLRLAIEKANRANVTKDSIKRAIDKGAGNNATEQYQQVTYEGYGPQGIAVLVHCLTDNKNRTVAEVRHAFTKAGGNLGTDGSVAYMFERRGMFMCETVTDEEAFMMQVLEYDVEDVSFLDNGVACVVMSPTSLEAVQAYCESQGYTTLESEVVWQAENGISVHPDSAEQLERLLHTLEDLDDVQAVFTNAAE